LEPLFRQACAYVRHCVSAEGAFLPFALAVRQAGQVEPFQLDKPQDLAIAVSALLKNLIPLVASGDIVATVVCTLTPADATSHNVPCAVFDIEHNSKYRVIAVMQLHKSESHGWGFGPIEYTDAEPKLFAA
jgi:hypothetical protein